MKDERIPDEEVERMRAAGILVPETMEEVRKLLEEAENDPERIGLHEAFRQLRARLLARKSSKSA